MGRLELTLPIEKIGFVKVLPDSLIVGLRWRAMVEVELGLKATILSGNRRDGSLLSIMNREANGGTTSLCTTSA